MDFNRARKQQNGIRSARESRQKILSNSNTGTRIYGPPRFDCLDHGWTTGEMLGILSGSGIGKTTVSLNIVADILERNYDKVVVFISLEMAESELLDKLERVMGDRHDLMDRIYIIDNYDEDLVCKAMTVHDIKLELRKIKMALNVEIAAVVIDHLHEINNNGHSDYNKVCEELRNMTKEINTFTIVQSQTTKEKGIGDVPVPRNGCFGTSRYENLMTYIITIFQPLRRVQNECNLPVLGWQYCKIRFKGKTDKAKEEVNYVLKYDFDSESLLDLTPNDKYEFSAFYDKVLEMREKEEKKKSYTFDLSSYVQGKDGQMIKITKIVSGGDSNEE